MRIISPSGELIKVSKVVAMAEAIVGMDMARWLRGICETDFMQHSISLTLAQARRECELEVLLQSMLLLDARHEGYEYKTISAKTEMRLRAICNDFADYFELEGLDILGGTEDAEVAEEVANED